MGVICVALTLAVPFSRRCFAVCSKWPAAPLGLISRRPVRPSPNSTTVLLDRAVKNFARTSISAQRTGGPVEDPRSAVGNDNSCSFH